MRSAPRRLSPPAIPAGAARDGAIPAVDHAPDARWAKAASARARMPASPARPVGSVTRALAPLEVPAASETGLGVSELARRIGVNASTASRLLGTLEHEGFVEREPGGPYRLGLKLVALADRVLARLDIRALA